MSADPEINNEQWEQRVLEAAGALDYPPTPDLAVRLRMKMMPALQQHRTRSVALRRVAFAAMAFVLLGVLVMAVPPARAAVLRWLRIGAVQITLQEPTTTPRPLSSALDIGGETPLDVARRDVHFPIKLPTYPSTLGPPDAVFVQELGDQTAMLVWVDPAQPHRVTLALQVLGPNAYVEKVKPRKLQDARVNGQPAMWASGEYLLQTRSGDMDIRRLITGYVLIWREGGITYRLETDLPMEEAVKIAESLR